MSDRNHVPGGVSPRARRYARGYPPSRVVRAQATAERIPGAELVVFEESGHCALYDEPERYLQVLTDFLAKAGSIVSVEARHAATIRDMLNPYSASFAGNDIVDGNGLDRALVPSQVLPKVVPFVLTPVSASQLP